MTDELGDAVSDNEEQLAAEAALQRRCDQDQITGSKPDRPVLVRPGWRTLKSAPIFWGRKELLVELRKQYRIGYRGVTLAAILGRETERDRREDPFCRVLDVLRRDLIDMLCRDDLEAHGFVEGSDPSDGPTSVFTKRWRVLQPDFDNCSAAGAGIKLFDVTVRSPLYALPADPVTPAKPADQAVPTALGSPVNQADPVNPPNPATSGRGDADAQHLFVLSVCYRTLKQGPCSVSLPESMFRMLKLLAKRTGEGAELVKNGELNTLYSANTSPTTIRAYMSSLRRELERAGFRAADGSELIRTHYRLGYSLRVAPTAIRIE